MEKKPRVLFVLYEGLADTVIDSQVLSHIRVMQEHSVAEFEVLVFDSTEDLHEQSAERQARATALAQAPVWIHKAARPGSPFSLEINSYQLDHIVKSFGGNFTHIHARTEYSVLAARAIAKRMQATLIWDCRGDAAAEVSYRYMDASFMTLIKNRLRVAVLNRRSRLAADACDRAIFVSSPLHQKMASFLGAKPHEILPSSAAGDLFFYNTTLRENARADLGLTPDRTVYVYSGSIKAYQRFSETIDMFAAILKIDPKAVFLVITPNLAEARNILDTIPETSFILLRASIHEMNALLNAADVAFMLRDSTPTNWVAAPTKFSEYCLAGLPVIMTDAVRGAHGMAAQHGNLIEVSDINSAPSMAPISREQISRAYIPILSRHGQIDAYRRIYSPANASRSYSEIPTMMDRST